MEGTCPGDSKVGIIRRPGLSLRKNHAHTRSLVGAELRGTAAGLRADSHGHMLVAHLCGNRSLGEILGIYRASSGIRAAHAGYGKLAGFAADLGGLHALGNRKARIRQALVNPIHDIAPDILVEGCAPVVAQQLVVIAAAPDPRRIVGGKAHKPDVPVVCGGSALARGGHVGESRPGAGGIDRGYAGAHVFFVGFQGFRHCVREKKRGGILEHLPGLRLIVNEGFSVVVQNFRKKSGLYVSTAVGDGGVGSGELQIGHAGVQSSQSHGRHKVIGRQGCDSHILGILHGELGSDGLHQAAHGNYVHGINNAVPDTGITGKAPACAPPVAEGLGADGVGPVIVYGAQRGSAGINGRRKSGDYLECGTRLAVYVAGAV